MSAITLDLPEELIRQLQSQRNRLPEILELGLRELAAETQQGFVGASEVLEFLAALPTPEEIIRLRPSERLEKRVSELLEKSRSGQLTAAEESEWERYEYLEHLVRMAKAAAHMKLCNAPGDA